MVAEQIKTLRLEDATIVQIEVEMSSHIWPATLLKILMIIYEVDSVYMMDDSSSLVSSRMKTPVSITTFRSVCSISTGAEEFPEEAIPLTSGMLAAGYQGVVATM